MTVPQAFTMVRTLIDESSNEFVGDLVDFDKDIRDALREASYQVVRELWYRGEKEALRPLWTEVLTTAQNSYQFADDDVPLFIESVLVGTYEPSPFSRDPFFPAVYVPVEKYSQLRVQPNIRGPLTHGRLEYTMRRDTILFQGWGARISYYRRPDLDVNSSGEMFDNIYSGPANSEWLHGFICERAASILMQRAVQDQEREALGSFFDLERILELRMQQQQQGAQ